MKNILKIVLLSLNMMCFARPASPDIQISDLTQSELEGQLFHAALGCETARFWLFVAHGVNPKDWDSVTAVDALAKAATCSDDQIFNFLKRQGRHPRVHYGDGFNALHLAKTPLAAQRLVNAGVDINAQDRHGRTPLMCAAGLSREAMITSLLNLGADATIKDKDGKTAADYAEGAMSEIVCKLKSAQQHQEELKQQKQS